MAEVVSLQWEINNAEKRTKSEHLFLEMALLPPYLCSGNEKNALLIRNKRKVPVSGAVYLHLNVQLDKFYNWTFYPLFLKDGGIDQAAVGVWASPPA